MDLIQKARMEESQLWNKDDRIIIGDKPYDIYEKALWRLVTNETNDYIYIIGSFKTMPLCEFIVQKLTLVGYEKLKREYSKGKTKSGFMGTSIIWHMRRIPFLRKK